MGPPLLTAWHRMTSALTAEPEGVTLTEENSHPREAVVDGTILEHVLHRVMYPQVHVNGAKKKKPPVTPTNRDDRPYYFQC
jgi:hypothetical protein